MAIPAPLTISGGKRAGAAPAARRLGAASLTASLLVALLALPSRRVDAVRAAPRRSAVQSSPVTAAAGCSTTLKAGSGKSYAFANCIAAQAGFSFLWNASSDGSGNTSVTFGVQRQWKGWIAFGKSDTGAMARSSALVSIIKFGRYSVTQYYLGDNPPPPDDQVRPGGNLRVSNLQGEYAGGLMTTIATISIPDSQAAACFNLIYAFGRVNIFRKPVQHNVADGHLATFVPLPPAIPPKCQAGY